MKKELELYLHIPFCVRKCAYCDFLSFPAEKEIQKQYVNCLIEEIRQFDLAEDYVVSTIFFGGGTPSVLEGSEIMRIMQAIRERFPDIREDTEITIECNPGTLTEEKLQIYQKAGINRLSLGAAVRRSGGVKAFRTYPHVQSVQREFLSGKKDRICEYQCRSDVGASGSECRELSLYSEKGM